MKFQLSFGRGAVKNEIQAHNNSSNIFPFQSAEIYLKFSWDLFDIYLTTLTVARLSETSIATNVTYRKLFPRRAETNPQEDSFTNNPFCYSFIPSRASQAPGFRRNLEWGENEFLTIRPWRAACQTRRLRLNENKLFHRKTIKIRRNHK